MKSFNKDKHTTLNSFSMFSPSGCQLQWNHSSSTPNCPAQIIEGTQCAPQPSLRPTRGWVWSLFEEFVFLLHPPYLCRKDFSFSDTVTSHYPYKTSSNSLIQEIWPLFDLYFTPASKFRLSVSWVKKRVGSLRNKGFAIVPFQLCMISVHFLNKSEGIF